MLHVKRLVLQLEEVDFFITIPCKEVDLLKELINLLLAPVIEATMLFHEVKS